ncbi:MAG: hypothetical protein NVS3B28_24330 [Candidatus Velthaea sp.]
MEWKFESSNEIDARRLRRELIAILRAEGVGDFDAAELIYGELIGNVVRHAPGRIRIQLVWENDVPVLTVGDEAQPFTVHAELPADVMSECGRGMYIVKTLVRDFHIRDVPGDGTEVRVTLPVNRARTG